MSITVTRDQWDRLLSDGEVWVAVDAWCSVHQSPKEYVDTCERWSNHVACRFIAPPDLVAATEPCPTCWGHRATDISPPTTCPDCDDGYPRVTVVTEPQQVRRRGRNAGPMARWHTVTLGTVRVAEVLELRTESPSPWRDYAAVGFDPSCSVAVIKVSADDVGRVQLIDLPDAEPGQWAVRLTDGRAT